MRVPLERNQTRRRAERVERALAGSARVQAIALVAFGSLLLFPGLGRYPLLDPSELGSTGRFAPWTGHHG